MSPPGPTPLRIGIIGLSSSPSAWATIAHLPRLLSAPNLTITALHNTSTASSHAALSAHSLPPTTHVHPTPAALAADPDVDLIVISTRVDTHYALANDALTAIPDTAVGKKGIYVEWPLTSNAAQAEELVELARNKQVRTIVGLQGRVDASVKKVREIIREGRLGDVHSINVQSAAGVWQNGAANERYSYFLKRSIGGNILTIYGLHLLDTLFFIHGEPVPGSFRPLLGNLRPRMHIQTPDGKFSDETHPKDTPDQIVFTSCLPVSPQPANPQPVNPVLTFHLRAGSAPPNVPAYTHRVYGTRAELIMILRSASPHLGASTPHVSIHDFSTGTVEDVPVGDGPDERAGAGWDSVKGLAVNIGELYEAFYAAMHGGEVGGERSHDDDYADWDVALDRMRLIEEIYDGGGM